MRRDYSYHYIALLEDGSLTEWFKHLTYRGWEKGKQVFEKDEQPPKPIPDLLNIRAISGGYFTALTETGEVAGYGVKTVQNLGERFSEPIGKSGFDRVYSNEHIREISAGLDYFVVLLDSGKLLYWGFCPSESHTQPAPEHKIVMMPSVNGDIRYDVMWGLEYAPLSDFTALNQSLWGTALTSIRFKRIISHDFRLA